MQQLYRKINYKYKYKYNKYNKYIGMDSDTSEEEIFTMENINENMNHENTLPTPVSMEENERYLENIIKMTEGEQLSGEMLKEANNFKNYLVEQYIKPDVISELIILGLNKDVIMGKIKIYTQYHDDNDDALAESINKLTNIPYEVLSQYKLYTIGNAQYKRNKYKLEEIISLKRMQIPDKIILIHPSLSLKSTDEDARLLEWLKIIEE